MLHDMEPSLAALIQRVRDEEQVTLEAIARRAGLPLATVGAWATGARGAKRAPSAELLRKLAKGLRVPEREVFAAAGRVYRDDDTDDDATSRKWAALGRDLSPEDRAVAEAMLRAFRRERGY